MKNLPSPKARPVRLSRGDKGAVCVYAFGTGSMPQSNDHHCPELAAEYIALDPDEPALHAGKPYRTTTQAAGQGHACGPRAPKHTVPPTKISTDPGRGMGSWPGRDRAVEACTIEERPWLHTGWTGNLLGRLSGGEDFGGGMVIPTAHHAPNGFGRLQQPRASRVVSIDLSPNRPQARISFAELLVNPFRRHG
jgi:hypothetical protein